MIKKVSSTVLYTVIILLLITGNATSQTGAITIVSVDGCQGDIIEIPVVATDLFNIGAITLFIDYSPESFVFDTLLNINPALNGLLFNNVEQPAGTSPGGKIAVSWSGFNSVDLGNENLFVLSFLYLGQNDSIVFSSNNEVADFEANILNLNYQNAQIQLSEEVSIIQQPSDLSVISDENGYFTIEGNNIYNYDWQYKIAEQWISIQDNETFTGQNSNTLNIYSPDVSLNETYFRCRIIGCNNMYSDSVQLFVQANSLWQISSEKFFSVYPNPANNFVNIKIKGVSESYNLSLFNVTSGITRILDNYTYNKDVLTINTGQFASGVYYILLSKDNNIRFQKRIILYK